MNFETALEKLQSISQGHILKYWDDLSTKEKNFLLKQIDTLDISTFIEQQKLLLSTPEKLQQEIKPFVDYALSGHLEDKMNGQELIAQGKVGCLLIAGGQGTRLKFNGPKGEYPVTVCKNKSLFQLFSEKTLAAGKLAGNKLQLAIMTSPINHQETMLFFEKHDFFGLDHEQISFFQQSMLPFLNDEGNLILENPSTIASGPDGNGESLADFYQSGVWSKWYDLGIKFLNYILVDNPLADPFDSELVGFHFRKQNEITLKCTRRKDLNEKVGMVVIRNNNVAVIEYSELPDEEKKAVNPQSELKHVCANLSLFCFNMNFIKETVTHHLPLHLANKSMMMINSNGHITEGMGWKFEKFIFDKLSQTKKIDVLLYPRDECFAPLKNYAGEYSLETVQEALQKLDIRVIEKLSGLKPSSIPFELAQDFHYPTSQLVEFWKGQSISSMYVEPYL